ncbi:MAG: hypothetical protein ACREBG_09665 [Pyrinomonadaceae bacterium]
MANTHTTSRETEAKPRTFAGWEGGKRSAPRSSLKAAKQQIKPLKLGHLSGQMSNLQIAVGRFGFHILPYGSGSGLYLDSFFSRQQNREQYIMPRNLQAAGRAAFTASPLNLESHCH